MKDLDKVRLVLKREQGLIYVCAPKYVVLKDSDDVLFIGVEIDVLKEFIKKEGL